MRCAWHLHMGMNTYAFIPKSKCQVCENFSNVWLHHNHDKTRYNINIYDHHPASKREKMRKLRMIVFLSKVKRLLLQLYGSREGYRWIIFSTTITITTIIAVTIGTLNIFLFHKHHLWYISDFCRMLALFCFRLEQLPRSLVWISC